jgi:diguanylate cyclase (GGDEF)-like protein
MFYRKSPFIVSAIIALCLLILINLYHSYGFESLADLYLESSTLVLLIYIYLTVYQTIKPYIFLQLGAYSLLFNKIYDLVTEIPFIEQYADNFETIDTILDDGSLLISFVLVAIGITRMTQKLVDQTKHDELTGLYNRKKFTDIRLNAFELIYFDLNGLKRVNDTKGHAVGDLMIIRFSQVLKQACLKDEMAFRVGGDEFVVIVKPERANEYVNKLYMLLENEAVNFSYGIEQATKNTFDDALVRADKAMYAMKQNHYSRKN